jgi:hypothetical protein
MRRSAIVAFVGIAGSVLFLSSPLAAQRTRIGAVVGYSLIGGGERIVNHDGSHTLTGASRAGPHLRTFVDVALAARALSLRGELFYNQLTSKPNTIIVTGSGSGQAALMDRTAGATASLVATAWRAAGVAPYVALGAGVMTTSLGYNPDDPSSNQVTRTRRGTGFGLVLGAGVRIRAERPTFLLEWRRYRPFYKLRGSGFMPLSLGVAF